MLNKQKELLKDETLAKKLITKWFWVYFFVLFTAPLGYILRMLISNTISVEEVGIFYSVLGLVSLLSAYNDLWLTESLQYFIPKYRIAGEKSKVKLSVIASFIMQMITGVLIFCLLYFWAGRLAEYHFQSSLAFDIVRILSFYFLGYNIIQLCSSLFVAFQDTFSQGFLDFCRQFSVLVFTLIFWWTVNLNAITYSYAWIFGVIFAIMVGIIIVWRKYRHIFIEHSLEVKKDVLKQHFSYALWVFLSANVVTLLGQVDQQVIVNVLWGEAAGYFSNFHALLMIFSLVVTPLLALLFPITTELISKNDTKKFWLLQMIMYSYFGCFALIISGFFVVFGQQIAVLLFGEAFRFSGYLLQFAAPFLIFNCWTVISFNILAGLGKIKKRLWIAGIALWVNLLLNLIFLILLWKGLVFSAMILSISWLLMSLLGMKVIYKEYPFRVDWRLLIKNLLLIILLWVLMFVVKWYVWFEGWWRSNFWILFAFFVGYCMLILLFNRSKIKLLLKEIKSLKKV